ncbi:hypothetical protein JCM10207_001049 [Rhodosporidiobolus poonsookiae]
MLDRFPPELLFAIFEHLRPDLVELEAAGTKHSMPTYGRNLSAASLICRGTRDVAQELLADVVVSARFKPGGVISKLKWPAGQGKTVAQRVRHLAVSRSWAGPSFTRLPSFRRCHGLRTLELTLCEVRLSHVCFLPLLDTLRFDYCRVVASKTAFRFPALKELDALRTRWTDKAIHQLRQRDASPAIISLRVHAAFGGSAAERLNMVTSLQDIDVVCVRGSKLDRYPETALHGANSNLVVEVSLDGTINPSCLEHLACIPAHLCIQLDNFRTTPFDLEELDVLVDIVGSLFLRATKDHPLRTLIFPGWLRTVPDSHYAVSAIEGLCKQHGADLLWEEEDYPAWCGSLSPVFVQHRRTKREKLKEEEKGRN